MRLTVRVLGRELLDVALTSDLDDVETGPPFGFSGGPGLHTEISDDRMLDSYDYRNSDRTLRVR